jgi:DNA polymerase III delta prime subunit
MTEHPLVRMGKLYAQLGWSVIPLRGKVPQVHGWTDYRASAADLHSWFVEDRFDGIGIVTGSASGNLAVIDMEAALRGDPQRLLAISTKAKELGVLELLKVASERACALTPSGGCHLVFQIGDGAVPGNTKLAFRRSAVDEPDGYVLLAETRGEGGQVAAPPGAGRSWRMLPPDSVPCSLRDWQLLCEAFASVDEADRHAKPRPARADAPGFEQPHGPDGLAQLLADALLAGVMSWGDFLDPGWTNTGHDSAGRSLWLRPAYGGVKTTALSSAHGMEGTDDAIPVLVVHSSSVPHLPTGEGQRLTPYRVLAACRFGDDTAALDRALEETAAGVHTDTRLPQLPASVVAEVVRLRQQRETAQAEARTALPESPEALATARPLRMTSAADVVTRRARWLWDGRMPTGALCLLAGREGLGKSTLALYVAARVTRGELEGEWFGTPRHVVVVATEDDWGVTVVPRLIAAGADLSLVSRVEAELAPDLLTDLVLPADTAELANVCIRHSVALVILDPLMSRINSALDTHKDLDVRRALEPLVRMAVESDATVLGLMHVNKSSTTDPLTAVMGSRAFTAVARSVSVVLADPDDDTGARRIFGTPKNNLGRVDLPLLPYVITSTALKLDDGETTDVGALTFSLPMAGTMRELLEATESEQRNGLRESSSETASWLRTYLESRPAGESSRIDVMKAARADGRNERSVDRAAVALGVVKTRGRVLPFPTVWTLPMAARTDVQTELRTDVETA